MENSVKVARETGRVSTIMGRSRKMLDISSSNYMLRSRAERASQNMPLQGSAADIVKVAMIRTYEALKKRGLKAKLILQVHDELIIDCPKNELEEVKEIVRDSMENAYKLNVPLTVDVEASYRWSDGH
jgi:DNA polymerase-1